MNPEKLNKLAGLLRVQSRRDVWRRIVSVLAVVVLVGVTYALVLPAITMDNRPVCGILEHTHSEKCYEVSEDGTAVLTCGTQEHVHDERCLPAAYTEPTAPAVTHYCGWDYEHQHGSDCYVNGQLTCTLSEHRHTDRCLDPGAEQPRPTQSPGAVQRPENSGEDPAVVPSDWVNGVPGDETQPTEPVQTPDPGPLDEIVWDDGKDPGEGEEPPADPDLWGEPGGLPDPGDVEYINILDIDGAVVSFGVKINGVDIPIDEFPDNFYGKGEYYFSVENLHMSTMADEVYYIDLPYGGFTLIGPEGKPLEEYTEAHAFEDDEAGTIVYLWATRNDEGIYRVFLKAYGFTSVDDFYLHGEILGDNEYPELKINKIRGWDGTGKDSWDDEKLAYRFAVDVEIPAYYNYYGQSYIIRDEVSLGKWDGDPIMDGVSPFTDAGWPGDDNITLTYSQGGEEKTLKPLSEAAADETAVLAYYRTADGLVMMNRKNHSGTCRCASPTTEYSGWCACWQQTAVTRVFIRYVDVRNQGLFAGNAGAKLINMAIVEERGGGASLGTGNQGSLIAMKGTEDSVPDLLDKEFNVAKGMCTITVNGGMYDLSRLKNVVIHDIMTNAWILEDEKHPFTVTRYRKDGDALIPEEMVRTDDPSVPLGYQLTVTPPEGDPEAEPDKDYESSFKLTPNEPGPYKYVITYYVDKFGTGVSANRVDLGGTSLAKGVSMTFKYDVASSRYAYKLRFAKVYDEGNPPIGAKFGFYNANTGKLFAVSYVKELPGGSGDEDLMGRYLAKSSTTGRLTDVDVDLYIPGDRVDYIFLDNYTSFAFGAFYLQEMEAPEGYALNPERYYFYLTGPKEEDPEDLPIIVDGHEAVLIGQDNWGLAELNRNVYHYLEVDLMEDQPIQNYYFYTLPETGGGGILGHTILGVLLLCLPCLFGLYRFGKRFYADLLVSRGEGLASVPRARRLTRLPDADLLYDKGGGTGGSHPQRE